MWYLASEKNDCVMLPSQDGSLLDDIVMTLHHFISVKPGSLPQNVK